MQILAGTLFLMFQAVFSWASVPMEAIKDMVGVAGGCGDCDTCGTCALDTESAQQAVAQQASIARFVPGASAARQPRR